MSSNGPWTGEGKAEDDGAASSRRPAPRLSGTLSSLASSTSSATSSEDWLFVQLADTQLGLYNQNPDTSCSDWAAEAALSRRAVAALNAMRPRPVFAVVCGDLTNAMPNGPTAQPDVCERQRRDFADIFAEVHEAIAVVCVCGNHDVGDRPSAASVAGYRRWFGRDYGAFSVRNTRCIVLNSSLFQAREEPQWRPGYNPKDRPDDPAYVAALAAEQAEALALADEQDEWLAAELRGLREGGEGKEGQGGGGATHAIAFAHIPPFIYAPDEPKGYFNFDPHVRTPLLEALKGAGVTKMFCGHFHRNAGGHDGPLEVVVTTAVGCMLPFTEAAKGGSSRARETAIGLKGFDWPGRRSDAAVSGLRVVAVSGAAVEHRFFTLEAFEEAVRTPGAVEAATRGGGGNEGGEGGEMGEMGELVAGDGNGGKEVVVVGEQAAVP